MKKILVAVGTRPEAIKMAPLILELRNRELFDVVVLATAQHRELLDSVFDTFNIKPDFDLNVMKKNQGLSELTTNLLNKIEPVLEEIKPDIILAQGDTTTVLTMCLSSFYKKIPFGHVEAGLRTNDINFPFPEEANRLLVSKLAKWNFAPTTGSKENLLNEGINENKIYMTGNTVIDALNQMKSHKTLTPEMKYDNSQKKILTTIHRRENFGKPLEDICKGIIYLIDNNPNLFFTIPMHPNPNVKEFIRKTFHGNEQVELIDAMEYKEFIKEMEESFIILSDSGGVQEEGPALGTPVFVLRNETERPEAIEAGSVRLIGTKKENLISNVESILQKENYLSMAKAVSPYGDGKASKYIADILSSE